MNAQAATKITTGTNRPATLSAYRWTGARLMVAPVSEIARRFLHGYRLTRDQVFVDKGAAVESR